MQENFGSSGIVRLRIEVSDKEEKPSNMIGVQFENVDEDYAEYSRPIACVVRGEDRDWVFITNSQLEERISKIKQFSLTNFLSRRGTSLPLFAPMLVGMLLTLVVFFNVTHNIDLQSANRLSALEESWKTGALKDSGELAIQIARIEDNRKHFTGPEFVWPLVLIFIVPIFLAISIGLYTYFKPSFNFLWGDYVAVFEKRRSRGRFLVVGIIIALAITIVGNFISKKMGL